MLKRLSILVCLLLSLTFKGQETVNSFPIDLKSNRDIFQIIDTENQKVNFFISDRKKVNTFLMDQDMNIKDSLSTIRPEKKYKDILGYAGNAQNPTIFWADKKKERIFAQSFNLAERKVTTQVFDLNLDDKEEKFLEQFSENGTFYVLVLAGSDSLKLYCFNGQGLTEKKINLKNANLYKSTTETANLWNVFEKITGEFNIFEDSFKISKIANDSPIALSESAKKRKLYTRKNEIVLTFDYSNQCTQLVFINLENFEIKIKKIEKPVLNSYEKEGSLDMKTNSFLIEEKLFQIAVYAKQLKVTVKDLEGSLLKEFVVNEMDDFNIKNAPFIRQNYGGSERELETTSQFLRKIVRSNVGLSVYNLLGNYMVTLGSVSPEKGGGGMGMPMGGGYGIPNGVNAAGIVSLQPINFYSMNYFSYLSRRSISTDCLFSNDWKHIPGKMEDLAFDKIQKYKDDHSNNIESETIFRIANTFYLGYYDRSNLKYSFLKFKD